MRAIKIILRALFITTVYVLFCPCWLIFYGISSVYLFIGIFNRECFIIFLYLCLYPFYMWYKFVFSIKENKSTFQFIEDMD